MVFRMARWRQSRLARRPAIAITLKRARTTVAAANPRRNILIQAKPKSRANSVERVAALRTEPKWQNFDYWDWGGGVTCASRLLSRVWLHLWAASFLRPVNGCHGVNENKVPAPVVPPADVTPNNRLF